MAMNENSLGALIKANIDLLTPAEQRDSIKVWTAVGKGIIQHIKTSAEIDSLTQSGIVVTGSATVTNQGATVPAQQGKIS